ncbi:MAG: hypothetical protein OXE95_07820 [Chloroflexi bacterium]|nr:hypothetical protein [Chloroflexota bacterium]
MKRLMLLVLLCLLIAPATSIAQKLPAPEIHYMSASAQGHEEDREYHGWCIQFHASPIVHDAGYRIRMHRETKNGKQKKVKLTDYARSIVDGTADKGMQYYFPDKQRGWIDMPIPVVNLGNGEVHVAYICGFAPNQTVVFRMAIGKDRRISQLTRKVKVALPGYPSGYEHFDKRFSWPATTSDGV